MKLIYTFLLFLGMLAFGPELLAQAPINDDCSGILDLGELPFCSQAAAYSNVNATTSQIDASNNVPSCWNNVGERDVWFQFSTPADGSITDVSIQVLGNILSNGTLRMPQLAIYRGDCVFGGLAELACAAAPLNVNEVTLEVFGLSPGTPYYLRINDYSANASPNAGTFKLCIEAYVPDVNLGDSPGTSSCSGTLWDTGGPDGDYESNVNETFVICPADFHQCIILNFVNYATESDFDYIRIYEGDGTSGNLALELDGIGSNFELQLPGDCLTIEFESDNSIELEGFQMTWQCSPEICDAPPPTLPSNATCDQALNINGCGNGPQIIPLSPGEGDPNFIQGGVNQGCIAAPSFDLNFSFFYFEAQANGKFGFAVQSANPNEASDIDFNVWGPISSVADICNFVSNNQPIRSSWDEGADLAGLADVHPVTGLPVTDEFDCGSVNTPGTDPPNGPQADDFVRRLDVVVGEIYVVMLDDFDGNIEQNGIAIDFSGTSDGVLGPLAPTISVTNDTFSCDGTPVQLQINGGITYAWTPSAGLSCNDCPNPLAFPTTSTTYVVKAVDVCQTFEDSLTVSVGPQVQVRSDTSVCTGQSVLMGMTVPQANVTYVWTPNDGSLSDPNIANPIATPTQTTVYTLTASSGPCVVTKVVTVAVVDFIFEVNLQDTTICKGNSVQILATANPQTSNISWTPLTQLQVQPNGLSAVATPNVSTTYQVTAIVPGCKRIETIQINVDSLPSNLAISPQDTSICAGQQVLLISPAYSGSHFPNVQFVWQTNMGQTLPDDEYWLTVSPSETTTYQRITTNGACSNTQSATVLVNPVPVLSVTPATPQICTNGSTNLQVGNTVGLSNFQWSPAVGLSCITCLNPTAAPAATTTYEFTADVANGCTAAVSVTVEVNQPPTFQFPTGPLCAGDSITLNLLPAQPGVTYSWTSNPVGFTSNLAQPTVAPLQNTTYSLTMNNGCIVQAQLPVQVIPAGMLVISDDPTVCAGVPAQIAASGSFPGTYVWSNGLSGQVISVNPAQTSTYTVTYSYPLSNPVCQIMDSVVVNVQGTVGQAQFPSDVQLCPGEGIVLNSIETPGATYSWTSVPNIFSSNEAIPGAFFPNETAVYTLTTTLGECTVLYSITVTVFNPQMAVTEDFTICAGEPFTISAEALLTGDYLWTPGGTAPTFEDTLDQSGQYTLQFMYGDNCLFEDTVNVSILPNFMLRIVSDPDTNQINAGQTISLDAFVPGTNVTNFDFEWLEDNLHPVGNTQEVMVTPETSENTISYTVTAVSPAGCVQMETIVFTVLPSNVQVPTAFTPNGDGANDFFGLAIAGGSARVEQMDVYSRWGQKVFSSTDANARWDGKIDNQSAPSDVYVYVIRWRGGDGALQISSGEVTLLR